MLLNFLTTEPDRLEQRYIAAVESGKPIKVKEDTYSAKNQDKVAIIDVHGDISAHDIGDDVVNPFALAKLLDSIRESGEYNEVIFNFDSPGGVVTGVPEAADAIQALDKAGIKTTGRVQSQCASACYWLAANCSELLVSKAASIGSIGSYISFLDTSKLMEAQGLKHEVIASAENKATGAPGTELTDSQRSYIQRRVNDSTRMFTDSVAKGRNLNTTQLEAVANGECWFGQRAIELGLADGFLNESENKTNTTNAKESVKGNKKQESQLTSQRFRGLREHNPGHRYCLKIKPIFDNRQLPGDCPQSSNFSLVVKSSCS